MKGYVVDIEKTTRENKNFCFIKSSNERASWFNMLYY